MAPGFALLQKNFHAAALELHFVKVQMQSNW